LFLDEVGDIPLPMQVKLLRLLESGTYRRVGSTELRHADIRVVSATHRDLDRMVAEGRFREDLYHRLSTFPIALPPLRERREDIALLTQALLARVAPQRSLSVAPKALALLAEQPFPGNVRELRNLLERTTLMCDGDRIEVEHVAQALNSGRRSTWQVPTPYAPATSTQVGRGAPVVSAASLRELELSALRERVATHTGSRAELAAALGISERSLYRKLKTLGV
jgi:DNA-binding NtrC family response regulator